MRRWLIASFFLFAALPAFGADAPLRFDDVRRVVAFADVHGGYSELQSLLRATGVVDEALRWQGGDTHLVSVGDLVDRGPDSRKVLDLLMRLEAEAQKAGGAVHLVLGNHEVMNIAGDLRYVSEAEYASYAGGGDDAPREAAWKKILEREPAAVRTEFDARYPAGYFAHREAFSATGRYGAWLLKKPFLLVVNDAAFAHGGLPAMVARLGLEATNATLHAQLADYLRAWNALEAEFPQARTAKFAERAEALAAIGAVPQSESLSTLQGAEVFTTGGPTWYRGQALCHPYVEMENLEAALAKLDVSRAVVGHTVTPTRSVQARFDGRVILLDTGMLESAYKGRPAALVYEQGRWNAVHADRPAESRPPESLRREVGARPAGLDDDALESWLAEAEVVGVEELDAGITQPQRVTLRKDGVELRAVFKQLSTDFGSTNRQWALDNADRFEYEVAAYRLDRLLALDMVPVTVPKTIRSRRGILQFWVDDAMNLRQMLERQLVPSGWCDAESQYNLMNVFDVLVHNTDRTQENALFTRDWTLVLIDHSRAFATKRENPRLLYKGGVQLSPALAARLAALDRTKLHEALGPWLHKRQIEAMLKRRDRLLDEHRARAGADERVAGP